MSSYKITYFSKRLQPFIIPIVVEFHRVSKTYSGEVRALRDVTVRIQPGEFVFVVGASGAGKSTFLKMLFASEKPTTGQVVLGGRNLLALAADQVALLRREIGIIFQDFKLIPRLSALDNVELALKIRGISKDTRRRRSAGMLEALGLLLKANQLPETLSGGEQQRVAIARALVGMPKLIIADEPTGNLDPLMARVVFDILLEANKRGITVVVATHNLELVEKIGGRVLILEKGALREDHISVSPKNLIAVGERVWQ